MTPATASSGTAPILCLVVDRGARGDLEAAVTAAVRGGVDWLQIRDRTLADGALLAWSRRLVEAARDGARARGAEVSILVNRRIDVALALDADGVHLGFDAVSPADARALLGREAEIGVSAHEAAEIAPARAEGASYAHLAPIFDPLSKPATRPALGLAELHAACSRGLPVIAQGGISASRCAAVRAAGAAGVAVTGAILQAEDPERAALALRAALSG